jgi:hypothetical protein
MYVASIAAVIVASAVSHAPVNKDTPSPELQKPRTVIVTASASFDDLVNGLMDWMTSSKRLRTEST